MFTAVVTVKTRRPIFPPLENVSVPLARIIAKAFELALRSKKPFEPEMVEVIFCDNAKLEKGTIVALVIDVLLQEEDKGLNLEAVRETIAGTLHQSGLFRPRYTPGDVLIEIRDLAHA